MLSWPTSPVARPSRPRFQPKTRRTVSVFHVNPSDQPFKMRARMQFSQRRMWLREIVRAWRRFSVLQIEIRLHAKAMAIVRRRCPCATVPLSPNFCVPLPSCMQLNRAFRKYTVTRRIMRKRLERDAATLIQKAWRGKKLWIKVKAATFILPLLRRHLWYKRRQRLRSLRHDAARAMQKFARRVLERMRAKINAEKVIKRSVLFYKQRQKSRFDRQVEWMRMRIAIRRIERRWFVEQAFRARVMVCCP